MNNNLPTTPGVYWWRANAGDEWDPVFVRDDSTVPGYEYTVLFPETGVEIDLPDLRGQWAKAHNPDEGVEAWAVFKKDNEEFLWSEPCLPAHIFTESAFICEPVTICRKGKE